MVAALFLGHSPHARFDGILDKATRWTYVDRSPVRYSGKLVSFDFYSRDGSEPIIFSLFRTKKMFDKFLIATCIQEMRIPVEMLAAGLNVVSLLLHFVNLLQLSAMFYCKLICRHL